MSADIIQLRDYQAKRAFDEGKQAVEIFNVHLIGPGGIDDLVIPDTAPSEMNPDDPA